MTATMSEPQYDCLDMDVHYLMQEKRDLQRQLTEAQVESAKRLKIYDQAVERAFELEASLAEARADIAAARELCPVVRRQDHFDDTMLMAVSHTVTRLFQMESRALQADASLAALAQEIRRLVAKWNDQSSMCEQAPYRRTNNSEHEIAAKELRNCARQLSAITSPSPTPGGVTE